MDLNALTATPEQLNLKLVAVKLPVELIEALRHIRTLTGKTNTDVYTALLKEGVTAFKAACKTVKASKAKPGRKPKATKKAKAKPGRKPKAAKVAKKGKAKAKVSVTKTGKRRGRPPKAVAAPVVVPPPIDVDADLE